MTERLQIYKCEICGNIVEVLHTGVGELVCCNQPMKLLKEQTGEQGKEKHVPVIEKMNGKIKVKIGSIPHPMEEKHHIEWIEIVTDTGALRRFLNPGDMPEGEFQTGETIIETREYCNIHSLWRD